MPIRIALEGNSSDAIKKSVIENGFLAVISVRLVEEEVKNGQIHVITNEDKGWDRFFSVVYHKNKVMTEEMKNLIGIVDHYKNVDVLEGISTGRLIK
jgi:DNA-binding transcriptional LysR family regulator